MFLFGKKDYFKPGPDGVAPVIAFVGKSMTVPVYDVPAAVGREKGQVDVLINDATVSRKHLLISTYGDKFTVTDQGSTVGTVINGETLEPGVPYYLSDGDKISIGKLDFVCHINRERTGKKLKLPTFIQKDTAGDTSEMSKADIAAAAGLPDENAEQADDLGAAAEVVKDAEQASEPVISLMQDPVLEELQDDEPEAGEQEAVQTSEPIINLMKEPELDESEEQGKADHGKPDGSGEPDASQEESGARDEQNEPEAPEQEENGTSEEAPEVSEQEAPEVSDGQGVKHDDTVAELEAMGETIDVMREHAPANRPKFVYYSGHTAVETFEITATPFVVGRAKSDYTPGAAGVSRRHCFIDRTGGTYYITDLESTNGVWINGRRIKPYNRTALENGDIVGIGDRVYKYEQE